MLVYILVYETPPSDLFISENMRFMQGWPELGCALLQLVFLVSFSQTEEPLCVQIGDPEIAQLSQDGDIVLGGIFYFHSSWKNREDMYTQKPFALQCIR